MDGPRIEAMLDEARGGNVRVIRELMALARRRDDRELADAVELAWIDSLAQSSLAGVSSRLAEALAGHHQLSFGWTHEIACLENGWLVAGEYGISVWLRGRDGVPRHHRAWYDIRARIDAVTPRAFVVTMHRTPCVGLCRVDDEGNASWTLTRYRLPDADLATMVPDPSGHRLFVVTMSGELILGAIDAGRGVDELARSAPGQLRCSSHQTSRHVPRRAVFLDATRVLVWCTYAAYLVDVEALPDVVAETLDLIDVRDITVVPGEPGLLLIESDDRLRLVHLDLDEGTVTPVDSLEGLPPQWRALWCSPGASTVIAAWIPAPPDRESHRPAPSSVEILRWERARGGACQRSRALAGVSYATLGSRPTVSSDGESVYVVAGSETVFVVPTDRRGTIALDALGELLPRGTPDVDLTGLSPDGRHVLVTLQALGRAVGPGLAVWDTVVGSPLWSARIAPERAERVTTIDGGIDRPGSHHTWVGSSARWLGPDRLAILSPTGGLQVVNTVGARIAATQLAPFETDRSLWCESFVVDRASGHIVVLWRERDHILAPDHAVQVCLYRWPAGELLDHWSMTTAHGHYPEAAGELACEPERLFDELDPIDVERLGLRRAGPRYRLSWFGTGRRWLRLVARGRGQRVFELGDGTLTALEVVATSHHPEREFEVDAGLRGEASDGTTLWARPGIEVVAPDGTTTGALPETFSRQTWLHDTGRWAIVGQRVWEVSHDTGLHLVLESSDAEMSVHPRLPRVLHRSEDTITLCDLDGERRTTVATRPEPDAFSYQSDELVFAPGRGVAVRCVCRHDWVSHTLLGLTVLRLDESDSA